MVLLDNLFSRKPAAKPATTQEPTLGTADAGPTNLPPQEEQALDRKTARLERRELLYAVVRESMARVGLLSTSYKYKVLSLDSRGNQYLIMMDLPADLTGKLDHLNEIEDVIAQNARTRHKIDVTAVYWRINPNAKNPVLKKARGAADDGPFAPMAEAEFQAPPQAPLVPGAPKQRFEPIRPDEVQAFRQAQAAGSSRTATAPSVAPAAGALRRPVPKATPAQAPKANPAPFKASEFPATEFEETQMLDEDRMPLSRTQYGDLI